MAKKYYDSTEIRRINPDFAIIDGGRNIGKTYELLLNVCIKKAYESNCEDGTFAYIRRKKDDMAAESINAYVDRKEIPIITKGTWDGIKIKRGEGKKFYFYKLQSDGSVIWSDKPVGIGLALYKANDYKSLDYAWLTCAIFEEYQTTDYYLPDEISKLLSIQSSLKREKEKFTIYMIANTVSRINPYVDGFGMTNYRKQEKGSIDIYKLYRGVFDENGNEKYYTIAREYCEQNENDLEEKKTGILLEKYKKRKRISSMIARGDWEELHQYEIAHPTKDQLDNSIYELYLVHDDAAFKIRYIIDPDDGYIYPYITPYDKDHLENAINTRIICDTGYYRGMLFTRDFSALSKKEDYLFLLIKNHCTFCNNLTGNEFFQCYK